MAYLTSDILTWAAAAQPLAAYGEAKRQYTQGATVDLDLHKKIYIERKSLAWQLAQDPTDADGILFEQGNYVYALLFPYLFAAQQATSGGGQVVTPTTPSSSPDRLDFLVSASSFLPTGTTSFTFPAEWAGFNMQFERGGISVSAVQSESSNFSWNRTTREFTVFPALQAGELIALIPC